MADVDALITLGDPWPNVGDARNDAALLGIGEAWEGRLEAMCRAELEQAHGRIRAVHRKRPARALHVGCTLPSGYGWTAGAVDVRVVESGSVPGAPTMSPSELRERAATLGGLRATARALGRSPASVINYGSGKRPVPADVARALRGGLGFQTDP